MEERNIYSDISQRTNGDIYIGVVGPVRTGKSTFIKKFMDLIVVPNMDSSYRRDRAIDEMPQSAAGRTIMTTEPKFVPEQAVKVNVDDSPDLASKYGIRSIPALLFFKGGEVVDQLIGVQSEDTLKRKLDALA